MLHEDPGNVSYSAVGGLSDQIRELRESIELPLMNPELFIRVGIKPPKVRSFRFWWSLPFCISCAVLNTLLVLRANYLVANLFIYIYVLGCSTIWSSWNW